MNWKLFFSLGFWTLLFLGSCRSDDISFDTASQPLGLSRDTVILDTVYNQMRSSTYSVKVFNKEDKDIIIPKIYLEKGNASQYRINVDGRAGQTFQNVPLRARDSLFIFIEIAPNINSREILVEDQIKIESATAQQRITLLSVVQDAEFLVSTSENPKIISENTVWDNSKVKIILGEVSLAAGKTLSINKGTKIYFMPNSGLKIGQNATLNIYGDLGEEVVFRGHRNEPRYDTIPKNWNAVILNKNATANINYAQFFGGTMGLYLDHAAANIKNSVFHTFEDYGIFAVNATINAENLVMNNAGNANLGIVKGGHYNILHATLSNYWTWSFGSALAISAQNFWTNPSGEREYGGFTLNLKNSIAHTRKDNAILFNLDNVNLNDSPNHASYSFENSLIKYGQNAGYTWDNNANIINSIANLDPLFINRHIRKMNLRVAENSPAKAKGSPAVAQQVPRDIRKTPRTNLPTIGAYQ